MSHPADEHGAHEGGTPYRGGPRKPTDALSVSPPANEPPECDCDGGEQGDGLSSLPHEATCATRKAAPPDEYLVDAGNYAMIEFMHPRHPQAFYRATDSNESAGRAWNNGHVGQTANTTDQENVRLGGTKTSTAGGFYNREGD